MIACKLSSIKTAPSGEGDGKQWVLKDQDGRTAEGGVLATCSAFLVNDVNTETYCVGSSLGIIRMNATH